MKNISLKRNINFDKGKESNEYELLSLKITDSLYKKDIGKFLETLSSHFIQKHILSDLQIQTLRKINKFLKDNKSDLTIPYATISR